MNKAYLVIWQRSHSHNITDEQAAYQQGGNSSTIGWKMPYNPAEAGRIETPIDVPIFSDDLATEKYQRIVKTLEKVTGYPQEKTIIHGIFLL